MIGGNKCELWAERNALADRCQTLEDENKNLLAENARLRRELERGRR